MSVIITGAESTKALISVRSLGRKGVKVSVGGIDKFSSTFFSRYSKKSFIYTDPKKDETRFIEDLEKFVQENPHDVLIPTHSRETYTISKYKKRLEKYIKIPVPDYKKVLFANNKEKIIKAAKKLKIKVPETISIKSFKELESVSDKISYPSVIKLLNESGNLGLSYVNSKNELIRKFKETVKEFRLSPDLYPVIQEFVSGRGYGTSVLYNKGNLRAIFTHKRIREYPFSGGPSTLRESVKNSKMENNAKKIMDYLDWHGVAMVEFKLDEKTGEPFLIEINPRFWGSINTAICNGVNFPYLLYKMALDGDIKSVLDYKTNIRTRFLILDLLTLPSYWKKSKNKISLIKDYFSFKNTKYDVESLDDFRGSFFYYLFLFNKSKLKS